MQEVLKAKPVSRAAKSQLRTLTKANQVTLDVWGREVLRKIFEGIDVNRE